MNKLSAKNIFIALIVVFAVSLLLIYSILISPTLTQKKELQYLKSQMGNANIHTQIKQNKLSIENYQQQFSVFKNTEEHNKKISSLLLQFSQDKNIKIESFEKLKTQDLKKFKLSNSEIILSGNFKDMLRFIYDLEYVQKLGAVASCNFYMEKIKKKEQLFAKIHLQNINFNID